MQVFSFANNSLLACLGICVIILFLDLRKYFVSGFS